MVILLLAAILAPLSSANADCGSRRGVVRSVKERNVVAAAETRSWMDVVACNSTCVLEFRLERLLGENAAAPPQTAEATKAVRKETILILRCIEELYANAIDIDMIVMVFIFYSPAR